MALKIEDIGTPVSSAIDKAEQAKIDNSLFYANQLGVSPEVTYDLEPELNVEYFGTEVISAQPGKMLKDSFLQSLADKPAMMLRGVEVYTPGKAFGLDPLLDKASSLLDSLKDPKLEKKLQNVASGKLWPIGDEARWWQVERKYIPEVINAWAANVGDQIPLILTTLAGRAAGKVLGKPIGAAAGAAAALITGGPDPSDVATAPAVVGITQEVVKHLSGAAPLIAIEAASFMDDSEALEIDLDIAEKYAKLYGLGSGVIEYSQQLWVLGRYSKIAKPTQDTILRQILSHLGGSVFEGVEEISQGGLENFLLQKAVAEMKERHPEYDKEPPNITEGWKRNGAIGAGVAAITGLPGTGMSIGKGQLARLNQVSPETKKFLGEPSVQEIQKAEEAPTEPVPAPQPPAEPIKVPEPTITPEEGPLAKFDLTTQEGKVAADIAITKRGREIADFLGFDTSEDFLVTVGEGEDVRGISTPGLPLLNVFGPKDATQDDIDKILIHEIGHQLFPKTTKGISGRHENEQKIDKFTKEKFAEWKAFQAKPTITPAKVVKKPTVPERQTLLDVGIPPKEVSTTSSAEAKNILGKKIPPDKETPPVVQKEFEGKQPELTKESKDAPKVLENYWREFDEREFEINVQTTKNQEQIAKAINKKAYFPKEDVETKDTSLAMMLYIDLKEHPEGHKFSEGLKGSNKVAYDKSQDLPANVQKIADKIVEQNRLAGELAVEQGVIKEARESYIAHLWERTPQREGFFAKFRQKTARARQRTLEGGIVEGLSKGMKLRVQDVTLASQLAQSQVNQANVGKKLLQIGKEWGLLSHQQEAEDWIKVEHPGFTTYRFRGTLGLGEPGEIKKGDWVRTEDRNNLGKVNNIKGNVANVHFVNRQKGTEADVDLPVDSLKVVRPRGTAFFITEEGLVMEKVPVYAEPELGKKLNNIFSPSALFKIPGVETITRYNAILKSTLLYTSLFHHQAFIRSYAFGSHGLNPVEAFEKGKQAIMNMEPEVRMLVRNGLTLGRIQDFDPRMLEGEDTIWGKAMSLTEPTEKANEWLQNLRRRQEKFLFNKLGPYLKVQAALLEFKAGMERNKTAIENGTMTADDVASAAATLMNNDFGGLHLGRMGRNNTVQHLMRLMLLAPDWTESNVRSMISAFKAGEEGYMHRMFWGRIAVKAMGATVLFNLLMSGFDDEDFVERYKRAWKEGHLRWLDIDITPIFKAMGGKSDSRKYFSLIGHFRDPIKFVAKPGASLKHKGSVVSRIMFDFASGQDWAGRQFTTVGELTGLQENGKLSGRLVKWSRGKAQFLEPKQLPSWFVYEGRQIMPIPIQNIAAFLSGEMEAFDAITKSMGLMTSTTFPKKRKSKQGFGGF